MTIYRLRQLYHALFPKIKDSEYLWLKEKLTQREQVLFFSQHLTEQRHALDVAYDIQKLRVSIEDRFGGDIYLTLLKSALLHDCGKSVIRLRLWQRIFIVASGYLPSVWKDRLFKRRNILGKTLVIYAQHPVWGKRLAAKAGVASNIQILIENHHQPQNNLERILYFADSRH